MKNRFLIALTMLLMVSMGAKAEDSWVADKAHFQIYASGESNIHFSLPIFSKGSFVPPTAGGTYIYYKVDTVGDPGKWHSVFSCAANLESNITYDPSGTAFVHFNPGEGDLIVTSMYNGSHQVITPKPNVGGQALPYDTVAIKKTLGNDGDIHHTIIELEWLTPERLGGAPITIKVVTKYVDLRQWMVAYSTGLISSNEVKFYTRDFTVTDFTGANNMITPQLFTPYLHQINETGISGEGYAAIPYATFYSTLGYRTSMDTTYVKTTDRSGTLFVKTTDTVQNEFNATFNVYRDEKEGITTYQRSTHVNILPYHHIYGFEGVEEKDSFDTYTGNTELSWRIINPELEDIVDGDFFELERSKDSTFSSSEQLTVVPLVIDSVGLYTFLDESRNTSANTTEEKDTTNSTVPLSAVVKNFVTTDRNGDTIMLNAKVQSAALNLPSAKTYYRIRRASSSVWGWDHEYAQKIEVMKNSYLSPLAEIQPAYTKDADYDRNHKVHFQIKLDNKAVQTMAVSKQDLKVEVTGVTPLQTAVLKFDTTNYWRRYLDIQTTVSIQNPKGETIYEGGIKDTFHVAVGSSVEITYQDFKKTFESTATFPNSQKQTIINHTIVQLRTLEDDIWYTGRKYVSCRIYSMSDDQKLAMTEVNPSQLIDTAYMALKNEYNEMISGVGKTMWDKTARLVLIRKVAETGQQTEMFIPQDSIVRQADGSWLASYTDVADQACFHYSYAVRIDQSKSDLRLQLAEQAEPKALSGPELYYDAGAEIDRFEASQGDARGERKKGVLLTWQPSNSSVDEYVLQRVEKGSTNASKTIYTGLETSYFDESAVPNQHYEYTVTANFNCNGKATSHYATAEGWRSPYGEISGVITLTDNSGMNGVQVDLRDKDNNLVKSLVTDASGAYLFDSLTYDIALGSDYTVIPTHSYAEFHFNNTSTPTAAVTLSSDNAVVNGLGFVNVSSVRMTGRVLYKNSTIPVTGAMFLLNGDTILRGSSPLKTAIDGTFQIIVPQRQPCRLQVFKPGHEFEGEGILRLEGDDEQFAITTPKDDIRFYDLTKVRLVGRVAGGNDQRDLKRGFGLGTNNLGDNLQLVLQLEGDNTAQIVHNPQDLTIDTVQQNTDHLVYTDSTGTSRSVGTTYTLFEKKRITIRPDAKTGEYAVDLFPVKYKVIQATASGYATLFSSGNGSEVIDLTEAPLKLITDTLDHDSVAYNAVYDRIYHNPVQCKLVPMIYGLEREGYGEPTMYESSFNPQAKIEVPLYRKEADGSVTYTLGYPLFYSNRKYQFRAEAYEDYYYNNDMQAGKLDRVPWRGGNITVRNGMHSPTESKVYALNHLGRNGGVWLECDHIDTESEGEGALRSVSIALETEGNVVETNVFRGFVVGTELTANTLRSTDADIQLLDIIRDPGGAGSYAYVESGASYTYSFTTKTVFEVGLTLSPTWGLNVSNDIGVVTAPAGAGSYIGSNFTTSKAFSFDLPISHKWDFGSSYTYKMTTNDRITTSSSSGKNGVGSNADVFLGTTVSIISGKAKSVDIINDTLYQMRQPAIEAGTMKVLSQGQTADGKPYYLVTGEKIAYGTEVTNTFVYTQRYIMETIIPRLIMERENLLMEFPDSAAAQAAADAIGEPVYWYHSDTRYYNDTLPHTTNDMIIPSNSTHVWTNEVEAIDNILAKWISILMTNEREKIDARTRGTKIGTYSVSHNTTYAHSETHSAGSSYNEYPMSMAFMTEGKALGGTAAATAFFSAVGNYKNFTDKSSRFGTSMASGLTRFMNQNQEWVSREGEGGFEDVSFGKSEKQKATEIGTVSNTSKFKMNFEPIKNISGDKRMATDAAATKGAGFTLASDPLGDITVSVYRAEYDSAWSTITEDILDQVDQSNNENLKYGSYVFYTVAGSTYCPHEEAEKSVIYNAGTPLGNETQWVSKPELSANTYEIANVAPDKMATFLIELRNQGTMDAGLAEEGTLFTLYLDETSNPNGAKVWIDGAPVVGMLNFWIKPGQPLVKTLEVERGTVDDYNLTIGMYLADCRKTCTTMNLGVHFLPVSSDVAIVSPRQNWVMNTLSPRDSAGYYLPIDISEFDIHHKNFDHIEFQYKLSTQSDEMWVNQCSFYADDSLYNLATGEKAMIENGRIVPFRFYGEKDPKEMNYDLRAVSYCRYGSGFVSKASPVISGTKDTRPPRVFGSPEPANSILGIGDHLKLRFTEAIAGNWLDEDNNFQVRGVTNEAGITAGTSLRFNGTEGSYAETKVERSLADKDFSIDLLVKPDAPDRPETFFRHGVGPKAFSFGKTADNRLYAAFGYQRIYSLPLPDQMLEFTRVVATYDHENRSVRFYVGTAEVTDPNAATSKIEYQMTAPLTFGRAFKGTMLEARVWTKALTQEEIAATNMKYLTGYERKLQAYYRMNEGKGDNITDRANGATLYLTGIDWNKQKGWSLVVPENRVYKLDGNLLSRSKVYDATYMFWFKSGSTVGYLFRAGWNETDSTATGIKVAIEDRKPVLYNGMQRIPCDIKVDDNEWHQFVLTINRTYGNASIFVDSKMVATMDAYDIAGIQGAMYLGGRNFAGFIDEFAIFEQALPATLIETYYSMSLYGDEMGLIGYLPFQEMKLNANGVMEQVFSVNDQREYRDANGNVVDKVVPLVLSAEDNSPISSWSDNNQSTPTSNYGQLTKLYFDWSYNNDELMINILNQDKEINKQSLYVTVRDVEDMNGNPMASPVTWTAYVDRNALKWGWPKYTIYYPENDELKWYNTLTVPINNTSGERHTYTIDGLPDWLSVNESYGTINPMESKDVIFSLKIERPVGIYTELVYLTDENGLSEPILMELHVEADSPYAQPDKDKYPYTMSLCGRVQIADSTQTIYDTDNEDVVYALYHNECIGMANVSFDNTTLATDLFMTLYGNDQIAGMPVDFILWRNSNGKTYNLVPDKEVIWNDGAAVGCSGDAPVIFRAGGSEAQDITLNTGWNWVSFNLLVDGLDGNINSAVRASHPWSDGTILKDPTSRLFCAYSEQDGQYHGLLENLDYRHTYMWYNAAQDNNVYILADPLPEDSMHITVKGNGEWSPMPCLLSDVTPISDALSDYYDYASAGDMIKSHDQFATFSSTKGKWVGDLLTMKPGVGYFFRRMAEGDQMIHFYNRTANAPKRTPSLQGRSGEASFSNPNAATNMTMIAELTSEGMNELTNERLAVSVFANGEKVGAAEPIEVEGKPLYFLTIQCDTPAELKFELDNGEKLLPSYGDGSGKGTLSYTADAHLGSLRAPILLMPGEIKTEKRLINNMLYIYHNGRVYNALGAEVTTPENR